MGGQIEYVKEQLRRWRGMEKVLEEDRFIDFYIDLNEDEREHVTEFIMSGDIDELRRWMKDTRRLTLDGKHIAEIRKIASELNIKYYNTLTKRQLIFKIRRIRRNEYSRQNIASDVEGKVSSLSSCH